MKSKILRLSPNFRPNQALLPPLPISSQSRATLAIVELRWSPKLVLASDLIRMVYESEAVSRHYAVAKKSVDIHRLSNLHLLLTCLQIEYEIFLGTILTFAPRSSIDYLVQFVV